MLRTPIRKRRVWREYRRLGQAGRRRIRAIGDELSGMVLKGSEKANYGPVVTFQLPQNRLPIDYKKQLANSR